MENYEDGNKEPRSMATSKELTLSDYRRDGIGKGLIYTEREKTSQINVKRASRKRGFCSRLKSLKNRIGTAFRNLGRRIRRKSREDFVTTGRDEEVVTQVLHETPIEKTGKRKADKAGLRLSTATASATKDPQTELSAKPETMNPSATCSEKSINHPEPELAGKTESPVNPVANCYYSSVKHVEPQVEVNAKRAVTEVNTSITFIENGTNYLDTEAVPKTDTAVATLNDAEPEVVGNTDTASATCNENSVYHPEVASQQKISINPVTKSNRPAPTNLSEEQEKCGCFSMIFRRIFRRSSSPRAQNLDYIMWFPCPLCPEQFETIESYSEHSSIYQEVEASDDYGIPLSDEYSCSICKSKFTSVDFYQQHMKSKEHIKEMRELHIQQLQENYAVEQNTVSELVTCNNNVDSVENLTERHTEEMIQFKHTKQLQGNHIDEQNILGNLVKCDNNMEKDVDFVENSTVTCNENVTSFSVDEHSLVLNEGLEEKSLSVEKNNDTSILSSSLLGDYFSSSSDFTKNYENPFVCEICHVSCTGVVPYNQHLSSSKHLKEVNKQKILKANCGLKGFNAQIDQSNKNGTEKSENLSQRELDLSNVTYDHLPNILKCDTCNITVTGIIPYQQHMSSIKHAKQIEKQIEKQKLLEKIYKSSLSSSKENSVCDVTGTNNLSMAGNTTNLSEMPNQVSSSKQNISQFPPLNELYSSLPPTPSEMNKRYFATASSNFTRCDICNTTVSGIIPYEQHINSSKHFKKKVFLELQKKALNYQITDINNQVLGDERSGSSRNIGKDNSCQTEPDLSNQKTVTNEEKPDSFKSFSCSINNQLLHTDVWKCEICLTNFSGVVPFTDHLRSKKHQKQTEKIRMSEKLSENRKSHLSMQDSHFSNTSSTSVFGINSNNLPRKVEIEGCRICGIVEFSSQVDRDVHFLNEDHLQAESCAKADQGCNSIPLPLKYSN